MFSNSLNFFNDIIFVITGPWFPLVRSSSVLSLRTALVESFLAQHCSGGPQAFLLPERQVEQPGTLVVDGSKRGPRAAVVAGTAASRAEQCHSSDDRDDRDDCGDCRRTRRGRRKRSCRSKTVSGGRNRASLLARADSAEASTAAGRRQD